MTVVDFTMPSLGADMDSGTITEWLVGSGDTVKRGDVVAIVETDKADIDVEVWHSGVLAEIVVPVGETVSVGTPLARIELTEESDRGQAPSGDGSTPPTEAAALSEPVPPTTSAPAETARPTTAKVVDLSGSTRIAASPLARRLAVERGVDLASVSGSGRDGAVIARDLAAHTVSDRSVAGDRPGSADGRTAGDGSGDGRAADDRESASARELSPAERMRRTIADLMSRSKREIPHYYLQTEVDLEAALVWLEAVNADRSVQDRVLPAALVMKAVAVAVAGHPEFNGYWVDGGLRPGDGVHLGVAVSLRGGGLVAPAIRDADRLDVMDLMAALRDVVGRSRSGRLRASEMTDSTITITNLGDRGVEVVYGVIHPPQVALIGVGKIVTGPAVVDDEVVARRQVTMTLAADHRASDGQRGARLLNTIDKLLQEPEKL